MPWSSPRRPAGGGRRTGGVGRCSCALRHLRRLLELFEHRRGRAPAVLDAGVDAGAVVARPGEHDGARQRLAHRLHQPAVARPELWHGVGPAHHACLDRAAADARHSAEFAVDPVDQLGVVEGRGARVAGAARGTARDHVLAGTQMGPLRRHPGARGEQGALLWRHDEATRLRHLVERVAAALLDHVRDTVAHNLGRIESTSVGIVLLTYGRNSFDEVPQSSGFIVSPQERTLLTACTWVSAKWPHLRTGEHVIARCSTGRSGARGPGTRGALDPLHATVPAVARPELWH